MPKALSLRDGVQKLSNSQTIFLNDFWDAKFLMPLDTILQASNRLYRVHYSLSVIDRTLRCAALRTHSFAWTVDLPLDPAHGQRERERDRLCPLDGACRAGDPRSLPVRRWRDRSEDGDPHRTIARTPRHCRLQPCFALTAAGDLATSGGLDAHGECEVRTVRSRAADSAAWMCSAGACGFE